MGNWTDHLARRAAGVIEGFIGNDEPVEAFLERTKAEGDTAEPTAHAVSPAEATAAAFAAPEHDNPPAPPAETPAPPPQS